MISRLQLMKIHALLAVFTLPVALMFVITGALYTWGIKGSYNSEEHTIILTEQLQPELETLTDLVKKELTVLGVALPSGQAKIRKVGTNFMLDWAGSSRDVVLETTDNNLVAKLIVKETTWYRNLVQLHKAKGGVVFKVYAAFFAVVMCLLLISGCIMAWQTPKLKSMSIWAFGVGIVSFLAIVWAS